MLIWKFIIVWNLNSPLYLKNCIITGTLNLHTRKEAEDLVVKYGGLVKRKVTSKTHYLILGNNDFNPAVKGDKSIKQRDAEDLISQGKNIKILSEDMFVDLIANYNTKGE